MKSLDYKIKSIRLLLIRRFKQLKALVLYFGAKVYVCFNPKLLDNNIWLLSERGFDARDNAFVFYKWIKKHHPEIECKYVITPNSFDYNHIDEKDMIWHGSWENYILFVTAKVMISTHSYGYSPNFEFFSSLDKYNIVKLRGLKVYLTHFIFDRATPSWNSHIRKLDLYTCGSLSDYIQMIDNTDYGTDVVKYTGTPRMDNLYNNMFSKTDNTILVMPTWRISFVDMSQEEFLSTDYCQVYNSLLQNKDLIQYLENNDIKIIFYPHIEAQKFIDCFSTFSDRIIIGNANMYVVEDLLLNSSFMITDYSSVHADFALMHKGVAYLQFDQDEEFKSRPLKTGFSFEDNGYGPVFYNENDLVDYIIKIKTFDLQEPYLKRIQDDFPLFDNNNCTRVYEEIIKKID